MARMSGKDFHREICRRFQKRFGRTRIARVSPSADSLTVRADELAELAEAVADEHCPRDVVYPEVIASASGITVSFGAYGEGFDGILEHRNGRFHIFCNTDRVGPDDSPRARFTLAHELGHYYIDDHRRALASGGVAPHPSQCDSESSPSAGIPAAPLRRRSSTATCSPPRPGRALATCPASSRPSATSAMPESNSAIPRRSPCVWRSAQSARKRGTFPPQRPRDEFNGPPMNARPLPQRTH